MRYLSRCINCGWNEESDYITTTRCPNCNEQLVINDSEYDNMIAHQIEKIQKVNIENYDDQIGMFKNIDKLGHEKCWEIIEKIKDPLVRISHRNLFLKVGGKIPKRS